jgi:KDO2-lipid IV(A) lauroyltransferase
MSADTVPLYKFLAPKYWLVWVGIGLLRMSALLPYRIQRALGRITGRAAMRLTAKRRRIAARNIELCFPELDENDRARLLHEHFESVGIGLFEMAFAWWGGRRRQTGLARVEGLEHLENALARGTGVLLLAGHFTTIELGSTLLLQSAPFYAMYRRFENPLFEEVMRRRRRALAGVVIHRGDFRQMLRCLKEGNAVLYMPDQAYVRQNSVLVPFFSIDAPTSTGTARLARATGAAVVPFLPRRRADGSGYDLLLFPALENFPSGDDIVDARRINRVFEEHARLAPEQYLWMHRRFKGQPGIY